jgi:hypothetical protein
MGSMVAIAAHEPHAKGQSRIDRRRQPRPVIDDDHLELICRQALARKVCE